MYTYKHGGQKSTEKMGDCELAECQNFTEANFTDAMMTARVAGIHIQEITKLSPTSYAAHSIIIIIIIIIRTAD
jgi:hypothetical protein